MSKPSPLNPLFFQSFEWHTPSDAPPPNETHSPASHWARLSRLLPALASLGVTSVWLPPGCKANNPGGNGYDCYDLWDLGEFDQKWTRSTKWGSREELRDLIDTAREVQVDIIWDAVLNHKTAGDATVDTWAVEVDKEDRRVEICSPRMISAWLKYDFPGRARGGMKYSGLHWSADHFNGTDWDQRDEKNAIFKLIDDPATHPKPEQEVRRKSKNMLKTFAGNMFTSSTSERRGEKQPSRRPGKGWAEDVGTENGNDDYLMFSNIYYSHPQVREDVINWGRWMIHDTAVHGFRLDAAQHFSWTFTRDWIAEVQTASRQKRGRDAFIVGEVWAGEVSRQLRWLDAVTPRSSDALAHAFDVPLLYSFSRVSEDVRTGSKNADLRTLLTGPAAFADAQALVSLRPAQAVTFVTNHDTQPGQSSYTPVDARIKPLFYAMILLRAEGLPCVFWGDLYGTHGPKAETPLRILPSLMLARRFFAYGQQKDYFTDAHSIGWTRSGSHGRAGCAVVLSIASPSRASALTMSTGQPGETWIDILAPRERAREVVADKHGRASFACSGMSVAVYVTRGAWDMYRDMFSAQFDRHVYN